MNSNRENEVPFNDHDEAHAPPEYALLGTAVVGRGFAAPEWALGRKSSSRFS